MTAQISSINYKEKVSSSPRNEKKVTKAPEIAKQSLEKKQTAENSKKKISEPGIDIQEKDVEIALLKDIIAKNDAEISTQSEKIILLTEEIAEKILLIKSGKEEIESLVLMKKKEAALNKSLLAKVSEFETLAAMIGEDGAIFKPTPDDMKTKLQALIPLTNECKDLTTKVDDFRSCLQRLCEAKALSQATLKEELKNGDGKFYDLSDEYLALKPRIEKQQQELQEIINKAKPLLEIPDEYINSFSAHNKISLKVITDNQSEFFSQYEKCVEHKDLFRTGLDHFSRRFDNIAAHLNTLSWTLGNISGTNKMSAYIPLVGSYLSEKEPYYSPTTAYYKKKIES